MNFCLSGCHHVFVRNWPPVCLQVIFCWLTRRFFSSEVSCISPKMARYSFGSEFFVFSFWLFNCLEVIVQFPGIGFPFVLKSFLVSLKVTFHLLSSHCQFDWIFLWLSSDEFLIVPKWLTALFWKSFFQITFCFSSSDFLFPQNAFLLYGDSLVLKSFSVCQDVPLLLRGNDFLFEWKCLQVCLKVIYRLTCCRLSFI